jgi:hypothetical protein
MATLRMEHGERYVLNGTPKGPTVFTKKSPEQDVPDEMVEALLKERVIRFNRKGGKAGEEPRFKLVSAASKAAAPEAATPAEEKPAGGKGGKGGKGSEKPETPAA